MTFTCAAVAGGVRRRVVRWVRLCVIPVWLLASLPAFAQIEWFVPNGMSYVGARAHASVSSETEDRCVFASLNEPEACPWCRQFDRCSELPLALGSGASSQDRVRAERLIPPALDASVLSGYGHSIEFTPRGFRIDARVATSYENRGTGGPGNRGIGSADGEVYLRVPADTVIEYGLTGRMEWSPASATGSIQLVGVPNTGADLSAGFVFQSLHLPGGSPASFEHRGRLMPGVYRLIWWVAVDKIGRESTEGISLVVDLDVDRAEWPQCRPDGLLPLPSLFSRNRSFPMTPAPVPAEHARPDRATRMDPNAPLVDINLGVDGIMPSAYPTMTRAALEEAGLPWNGCVVVAHGSPGGVAETLDDGTRSPFSAERLAERIDEECWEDEPVVLLACNTGRPSIRGPAPFAQRLARLLRDSGRVNATVWAPDAFVQADGWLTTTIDASIVLSDAFYLPRAGLENAAPESTLTFIEFTVP